MDCPGFSQNRVNFHWNPGRGTARWADSTWPNRTGYSIPCAIMLGSSGGGSWATETHSRLGSAQRQSGRASLWVVRFVLCFLLICIVVVTVLFVCCSVKLPLSRPTSICLFLSILLHTLLGEVRPRGAFVASRSQTITWTLSVVHCLPCQGLSLYPAISTQLCLLCSDPLGLCPVCEGTAGTVVTLSSWVTSPCFQQPLLSTAPFLLLHGIV